MEGKGGMGRAKVAHSDSKVADKLHTTRITDDKVPPGGLVGVVGQTCVHRTRLAPLVSNRAHIDPSPLSYQMGERGEISSITAEIPNKKCGAFRSE